MALIKIYGAPGTGKTTYLMDMLDKHLSNGVNLKTTLFCSFSNSAINEVCDRLGIPRGSRNLKYFKTLHGICASLALDHSEEFKEAWRRTHKARFFVESWRFRFCKSNNIDYEIEEAGASDLLGNRVFSFWTAVVGTYYPKYHDIERCLDKLSKINSQYGYIIQDWLRYKKQLKIIDYEDMLIEAYNNELIPAVNLAFFDEAQDFNRLEFEIVKRIIEETPTVYMAGDDDQAIYTWKGAKATYFLKQKADSEIVLPKTYRLPAKIWSFATKIIKNVRNRKQKQIEVLRSGGLVEFIGHYTIETVVHKAIELNKQFPNKTIYLLFRINRQVKAAEKVLLELGVPYQRLKGKGYWHKEFINQYNAIAKLRKNQIPNVEELKALFKILRDGILSDKEKYTILSNVENGILPLNLTAHIKNLDTFYLIDPEKCGGERQSEILRNAYKLIHNTEIRLFVDTIHAAKGKEADIVILCDGITNNIRRAAFNGFFEDELRVWYTGATRARHVLLIAYILNFKPFLTEVVQCP